jgi:hypothetical protein
MKAVIQKTNKIMTTQRKATKEEYKYLFRLNKIGENSLDRQTLIANAEELIPFAKKMFEENVDFGFYNILLKKWAEAYIEVCETTGKKGLVHFKNPLYFYHHARKKEIVYERAEKKKD